MRRRLSIAANLLAAALALSAWFSMTFSFGPHGALSAPGLGALKYFTVLSNLFQAVTSIAWVVMLVRQSRGRIPGPSRRLCRLKYAAAVAVGLTFFTVLLFLGPLYGYESMYDHANLWFHLVVPLLAMVDFALLDRAATVPLGDFRFAMLPMLAYAVYYIGNLLVNGVGKGANTNDWYGFAKAGLRGAILAFVIILTGNAILALLLRLPRRPKREKR